MLATPAGSGRDAVLLGYSPIKPGTLKGPGDVTGRNMYICLSPIDEHLFSAGAEPDCGFWEQVANGPCSKWMLLSCSFCFIVPAAIHLVLCEGWPDRAAGLSLGLVSVTSTLCDSICVHAAVYESGGYDRTAKAVGTTAG
ncbi:unnamed protein product [Prorocentrum cordatum]|uniref:Uncharacterized protein n=1 Tax=Prorocentrum cordatum TaxID=2364126 RepID=A0ABN9QU24_9DINO|nr:unnamed protein product [Polarella glacialis]